LTETFLMPETPSPYKVKKLQAELSDYLGLE